MIDLTTNYEVKLRVLTTCLLVERFYNEDFLSHLKTSLAQPTMEGMPIRETTIEEVERIFNNRLERIINSTPSLKSLKDEILGSKEEKTATKAKKKTTTKKKRTPRAKVTSLAEFMAMDDTFI